MIEKDAYNKVCPILSGGSPGLGYCRGSDCMAWEEWTDPQYAPGEEDKPPRLKKRIGDKPKDPPQGHCGMVPPELNCNCG